MIVTPTSIKGVCVVDIERLEDERGFFARSFCRHELADYGIDMEVAQCNLSYNRRCGTLRGMHFQADPKPEPKLVSCIQGRIFDVAVDLRPSSETYCQWVGQELDSQSGRALFIPPGCAHGFQTLVDHATVFYLMGERYDAELSRGVRWDDPAFDIRWPIPPEIISERDSAFALLDSETRNGS